MSADSTNTGSNRRRRFGALLCKAGRHSWEPQHHEDLDGGDQVYFVCRRCAKERWTDGPPTSGRSIALGGV
jgi:hypothetical protein